MEQHRGLALSANNGFASFGVKKYSIVLGYGFDVINKTPQDIMHVLHEGIARRLVMIFFHLWISSKRASVSELNYRICEMDYGYTHSKNRIKRLNQNDFAKETLVISSAQMHSLILLFPIIFFDILDTSADEYKCFYYFLN